MWNAIVRFVLVDGDRVLSFWQAARRWQFWAVMLPCFVVGIAIGMTAGRLAGPAVRCILS
jgi:hypothetical protein